MLTQTEYLAIAAQIDFPSNAWINGSYTPAISGETFSTLPRNRAGNRPN